MRSSAALGWPAHFKHGDHVGLARFAVMLLLIAVRATSFAQGAVDAVSYRSMIPVIIDGNSLKLEMAIHKPSGVGPFPAIVFNHGSTGHGTNAAFFKQ